MMYVADSPEGRCIDSILVYSNGFILGGTYGMIWTFATQDDDDNPYSLSRSQPLIKSEKREQYFSESIKSAPEIDPGNITSLALDGNESILYYIDNKN